MKDTNEILTNEEAEKELNETMLVLLRKEVMKKLLAISPDIFTTGSCHWFGTKIHEFSDYDICVPFMFRKEVEQVKDLYHLTGTPAKYNSGEYLKIGVDRINVIFLTPNELKPWKLTTDIMEFLIKNFDFIKTKKQIRVRIFGSLVAFIKMIDMMSKTSDSF